MIDVGQDIWHKIYFINQDGTVGSADVDLSVYNGSEKIEIENKISGLKNIVLIVDASNRMQSSGSHFPFFIDIDGNVFTEI